MDKQMERYLITALVLILLGIGLSGCGTKIIQVEKIKQPTQMETISRIPGIVNALGCMFAPADCSANKEPAETEESK